MQFGDGITVKCPYCQAEKQVSNLLSCSTIGGQVWTDMKTVYPQMLRESHIQQCPKCGKYYFLSEVEQRDNRPGEYIWCGLGELDYPELKEAYEQKVHQEGEKQSDQDKRYLARQLVMAYNDLYNRVEYPQLGWEDWDDEEKVRQSKIAIEKPEAPAEEKAYMQATLKEIIDDLMVSALVSEQDDDYLLVAEYYRELGDFEQCLKMLEVHKFSELQRLADLIIERAKAGDTRAVEILDM